MLHHKCNWEERKSNRNKSQKPQRPDSLDLYTVAETAAILNVSKRLVFEWIRENALPVVRLGPGQRLIRIRRSDLEQFIEKDFESSRGSEHHQQENK